MQLKRPKFIGNGKGRAGKGENLIMKKKNPKKKEKRNTGRTEA